MKIEFLFPFLLLLVMSCNVMNSPDSSDSTPLGYRFRVETTYGSSSVMEVFLEGDDGNMVTGSTVIITNSHNSVTLLPFSWDDSCYRGGIPTSSDGEYNLIIKSRLCDDDLSSDFEHYALQSAPQVVLLQNPDGTSALSGFNLSKNEVIQIGWDSISNASIYQVLIYKDGTLAYSAAESSCLHEIAAGSLGAAGTYAVQVSAQYIKGDPLFIEDIYYSFSDAPGATTYCEIE